MGADLGCCANVIRAVFLIINFFFGAVGIAVFGVGIWAVVESHVFEYISDKAVEDGGAILIAAGVVTVIICVIGILGAIFKARPLLVVYAWVVVLIVVLEIIAAIIALVFRDELLEVYEDRFLEAISLYRVREEQEGYHEDVNSAVDSIQFMFDCCGYNNASDWINLNLEAVLDSGGSPPDSCLTCNVGSKDEDCTNFSFMNASVNVSFSVTGVGCSDITSDSFTDFAYTIGGFGIAVAVFEITGIVLALSLCCCITSALTRTVV